MFVCACVCMLVWRSLARCRCFDDVLRGRRPSRPRASSPDEVLRGVLPTAPLLLDGGQEGAPALIADA